MQGCFAKRQNALAYKKSKAPFVITNQSHIFREGTYDEIFVFYCIFVFL